MEGLQKKDGSNVIGEKNSNKKKPITQETIFKMMCIVAMGVSGAFFLKNVLGGSVRGIVIIGGGMVAFGITNWILKVKNASLRTKQLTVSVAILVLIFCVSINSGAYFSDDFILYLAVICMTSMYLEPHYSAVQLVVAAAALLIMYVMHPEKADPLGQYLQCWGIFILSGILLIQTIKRGRIFIEIGDDRAKEAEALVNSMKEMGVNLENDFARSSQRINNNTADLQQDSVAIVNTAQHMQENCDSVQDCILLSQKTILELNEEVGHFEAALWENQSNMEAMEKQLAGVVATINETNTIFKSMAEKMGDVVKITDQMGDLSFNTSILSLNASIEAARAGKEGAGFDVVATEMRKLSDNSNVFSEQVADVIKGLVREVGETAQQFTDSTVALEESKNSMNELRESFLRLTEQFTKLYSNIEEQNNNVSEVGVIFNRLQGNVEEMYKYSAENQSSVGAIIEAMDVYKGNIENVIEQTRMTEV